MVRPSRRRSRTRARNSSISTAFRAAITSSNSKMSGRVHRRRGPLPRGPVRERTNPRPACRRCGPARPGAAFSRRPRGPLFHRMMQQGPGQHVVQHAAFLEQRHVLEGLGHPQFGDAVGGFSPDVSVPFRRIEPELGARLSPPAAQRVTAAKAAVSWKQPWSSRSSGKGLRALAPTGMNSR